MKFWLSAEVQDGVSHALSRAQLKIERTINAQLTGGYGTAIEEWALISILRPKIPDGWGEVYRYHRERRVIEFRLILDYKTFKSSGPEEHTRMLLQSILRSFDLFPQLNVADFHVGRLRGEILDVAASEHWV